jgi:MFS family permease
VAALLAFSVLAVLVMYRRKLELPLSQPVKGVVAGEGSLAFLKIPAVWMCFTFFFVNALGLSAIQAFAPEAARRLHDVPLSLVAMCLTVYMLGSACGMFTGGFLAANPARCERIVGWGFGSAALISVALAFGSFDSPIVVPVLFALMGFCSGLAAPSRDLLVKRSTPENATGRVYGVVYSGLDIGQALSPLFFGVLMDHGNFRGVLLCLALVQGVLIISAFSVGRVRRTSLVTA